MEKKQTAVEWLVGELTFKNDEGEVVNAYPDWIDLTELIERAKAMHMEEIMQSLNDGKAMALGSIENLSLEQYYNEQYGK